MRRWILATVYSIAFLLTGAGGTGTAQAAPVWPSMLVSGCNIYTAGGITCNPGGIVQTQINSGYACNQLDITVTTIQNGPFILTATTQDGTNNQNITIDAPGDYYLQFPFFLTNNLISIQISTAYSSAMLFSIGTATCTPPSDTPTVNPSFTPTDTPAPVTGTPTAIPTSTPLPSGHSTFTPTITRTPVPGTSTPTVTLTPFPSMYNCGDPTFPMLNCGMGDNISFGDTFGYAWYGTPHCFNNGTTPLTQFEIFTQLTVYGTAKCEQDVTAHATGDVYMTFDYSLGGSGGGNYIFFNLSSNVHEIPNPFAGQTSGGLGEQATIDLGPVTNGDTYTWYVRTASNDGFNANIHISDIWVGATGGTPLPTAVATFTPTLAPATATQAAAETATAAAANFTPTSVPAPNDTATAVPSYTPCPGGCAVAALTQVPGVATILGVDTSPLSPLENLSLARSPCVPFGYAQIPYPHIIGTPAFGSTNPISYTWTVPATDTTNAIEPCAMTEVPQTLWDLTYWLSVLMVGITFILWLVSLVGRLSGDKDIDG